MPLFGRALRRAPGPSTNGTARTRIAQTTGRSALLLLLVFGWLIPVADAQQTIHVPADQPTIQAGINAANKGDTVLVAPGVYHEYIDFQGKAITVTSSGGAAVTLIDSGSASGTATVNFLDGELRTSVLSNFTIQGGGNANALNTVPYGGIFVANSAPTILNNTIVANACSGVAVIQGAALIQGNTIGGTLTVNNNCPYSGAAVLLTGNSTVKGITGSTISGNMIQNNVQGLTAGGIVVEGAASPVIQNNTISNNKGAAAGGILLQTSASATIQGNTIAGNVSGCAGGISVDTAEGLLIESNILQGNTGGCVGGITIKNTQTISILQNLLYGNSAVSGNMGSGNTAAAGGVSVLVPGSTVGPFIGVIAGNTMSGDTLGSYTAGESAMELNLGGNLGQYAVINNILVAASSSIPTTNCSVSNNKFSLNPLVFDHNDLYNPQGGGNYGGACPDQSGTFGNISADPQFVSPVAGGYQLKSGSPAIDAGNNSAPSMTTTDLAGAARIQDATGKGYPVVDMGAYEFAGAQDGQPATLDLTPSSYGTDPQLSLTVALSSPAGTATGPFTLTIDGVPVSTTNLAPYPTPPGATNPPEVLAIFQGSGITPGRHAFVATYAGSGAFTPAVSVKLYATAELYGPTLLLTSAPNPSNIGQSVTFTTTLTSPDGAFLSPVTVEAYYPQPQPPPTLSPPPASYQTIPDIITPIGIVTPNAAGVAMVSFSGLGVGANPILATYAGDATHYPVTTLLTQNVVFVPNTPPTLTSSLNPSGYGQPVTFTVLLYSATANVGPPSGSVVFSDGTTMLATVPLYYYNGASNIATYTTSMLAPGSHSIKAVYVPTGNNTAVTLSLTQVVIAGPSATSTSLTLCVGPSTYCPASGGGVSAPNTSPLTEYYGQTFNEISQAVSGDGTALTGTISFIDVNAGKTTTLCVIPVAPGNYCPPSFNTTFIPGANVITAVYSGDATHLSSTSAPITIDMVPTLSYASISSSSLAGAGGSACPPGIPPVIAFNFAYPPVPYTAYFGQPNTFSVLMNSGGYPAPTGSALILDQINDVPPAVGSPVLPDSVNVLGTVSLVPEPSNPDESVGSFTTSSLAVGTHPITVYYPGNAGSQAFASTQAGSGTPVSNGGCVEEPPSWAPLLIQNVLTLPTLSALTSSNNPSIFGQPVTFTATVIQNVPPTKPPQAPAVPSQATITGPITFYDGNTALATVTTNNGTATFTTSSLSVGSHTITTTYAGNANIGASFGYVSQLVYVPVGGGSGGGSGGSGGGSGGSGGGGSGGSGGGTSPGPVTTTITVTPSSLSVGVGGSLTVNIAVAALATPQIVTLACSNLPTETACSFANPVIPAAGGSTTLVISTTAPHDCGSSQPYFIGYRSHGTGGGPLAYALPALAGIAFVLIPGRRRWLRALMALIAIAVAMQITGCGNCTDLGTRPNTYTIQITGTASGAGAPAELQNVVLNVTL
jgi:parallel beta-helix repeat protein